MYLTVMIVLQRSVQQTMQQVILNEYCEGIDKREEEKRV